MKKQPNRLKKAGLVNKRDTTCCKIVGQNGFASFGGRTNAGGAVEMRMTVLEIIAVPDGCKVRILIRKNIFELDFVDGRVKVEGTVLNRSEFIWKFQMNF